MKIKILSVSSADKRKSVFIENPSFAAINAPEEHATRQTKAARFIIINFYLGFCFLKPSAVFRHFERACYTK